MNKNENTQTNQPGGLYSQSNVNILSLTLSAPNTQVSQIAGTLELASGFPWMYDGQKPVELGFHVYPEGMGYTTQVGGANFGLSGQQYYYKITYEWTDATLKHYHNGNF